MPDLLIENVLGRAYDILAECGLAKQMNWDPSTGSVDVDGAILLACDAKGLNVIVEDVSKVLAPANIAKYTEALWQLDAETDEGDVVEWADREDVTLPDVLALIQKVQTRLRF